jgi:hypothetical protein
MRIDDYLPPTNPYPKAPRNHPYYEVRLERWRKFQRREYLHIRDHAWGLSPVSLWRRFRAGLWLRWDAFVRPNEHLVVR